MRAKFTGLLVAASLGGGLAALPAATPTPAYAKACRYGTIGGHRKHLCRGQFCSRAHAREYRRYGLACTKRDRTGRYHLR
jgi:hypothetical protein